MRGLLVSLVICSLSSMVIAEPAPLAPNSQEPPHTIAGAQTVDVLQARILYEQGAMFVDVRPEREWSWGHVRGAVHLDLDGRFASLSTAGVPRNTPMVIYCDSEVCPSSARAVHKAVGWGFKQVYYFRSGYFAWQLLDFPLSKGAADEGQLVAAREAVH